MKIFESREVYASKMIEKYYKTFPNNIVSDVGSGFGWMQQHVKKFNLIWQPFDYVKKIEKSIIWDLNYPCPENAVKPGSCVMLEVLEHLPNPLLAIKHLADHLLPGAILIISVPNPSWSRNRLHLLLKGKLYSFQEKHLLEYHVFTPWRHIVEFFFNQNGFEVLEYVSIQPLQPKITNIKELLLKLGEKFLEMRDPMAVGLSYGLVLKKKYE
jgi:2-polyprenyl-3-methyl-5-hydroxy-6-metoxy-1,4-benzoquinol methylase